MRALLILSLSLCLMACRSESTSIEDFHARDITLPDGTTVKAEVMMTNIDMGRGMMFRDSFPEGRAMLFIHSTPNKYPYWMYETKVPLDIVWLDKTRRIVEIVENAPPCKTKSSECALHGGNEIASYVVEFPAGYARKHGVRVGEYLRF